MMDPDSTQARYTVDQVVLFPDLFALVAHYQKDADGLVHHLTHGLGSTSVTEAERAHKFDTVVALTGSHPAHIARYQQSIQSHCDDLASYFAHKNGEDYYYGTHGAEKDSGKALEWFVKAADRGHLQAVFGAGVLYKMGVRRRDLPAGVGMSQLWSSLLALVLALSTPRAT